jgi:hypothetical protein
MHIPALEGFGLEIVEQVAIPIRQGIGNSHPTEQKLLAGDPGREQGTEKQVIVGRE